MRASLADTSLYTTLTLNIDRYDLLINDDDLNMEWMTLCLRGFESEV